MATYIFVINSFLAGGAERSLLELLPRLGERGVRPIVATLYRRDVGFEDEARAAGHDIRLLEGDGRLAKVRSLRALIKSEEPDLVYTSLFDADIAGRLACLGLDVPVISNLANTAYDPARLADPGVDAKRLRVAQMLDGFTARHMTDHFHAVSQAVKDSSVLHLSLDPDDVTVVRRGRSAALFAKVTMQERAEAKISLGLAATAEVIVTVGRQEYQKGQIHLVEAFSTVHRQRPASHLVIAGREGHATNRILDAIRSLGLDDSVLLLGHRTDIPSILAAGDVFAFPSMYEGLGGALIEAMALGLAVVATDLPAIREVVQEGRNAILVNPADPDSLSKAIVELLDDSELRTSYGLASRDLFESGFDGVEAADQLADLLDRVAAED